MKILFLVRHAKSSWDDPSAEDFDRPLSERGKRDAPEMAGRLRKRKMYPDLFLSSPAKRARSTAKYFCREFDCKPGEFALSPSLYLAGPEEFLEVIAGLPKHFACVALFSHNPGITAFANELTEIRIDNIPTCGVFAVQSDTESWSGFEDSKKEFLFFDYPKLKTSG